MSYEIHAIESFILKKTTLKEYDSIFEVYTREFGIIQIIGYGILRPASKLRQSMDMCSLITIEIIRGREFWILIGAKQSRKLLPVHRFGLWEAISSIIKKYSGDHDEYASEIFEYVVSVLEVFKEYEYDSTFSKSILLYITMRILYVQGYWPHTLHALIFESPIIQALALIEKERRQFESDIDMIIKRIV